MQPIDLDLVREFCELAETHNLAGLDISYKDFKLKLSRVHEDTAAEVPLAPQPRTQRVAAAPPAAASNLIAARSPLAGVFYRAPRPSAPAFVEVGDEVTVGQTLCIIEAMKLMNEITAEVHGRVHRILIDNAQVVEAGQEIILLELI